MPEARITEFGNVNVQTTVLSRSAGSTYVVDRPSSGKVMSREDYERVAAMQDAYLAEHDVIQIDGWIGNDPELRTRARLVMEKRYANIAGMQQKLYFPRDDGQEPEVQVLYTPGLAAPGYPRRPGDRGRPGRLRDAGPELGLLRGVQEGRPADVERHRLRQGRARAARRPQGDPDRRTARRSS